MIRILKAMKLTRDDAEPNEVFEDIYIGSIGAAYNSDALEVLGITHILCCAKDIKPKFPSDFKYESINAQDLPSEGILHHIDQANDFIELVIGEN